MTSFDILVFTPMRYPYRIWGIGITVGLFFLFLRSDGGFEITGSRRLEVKVSFDGEYVPIPPLSFWSSLAPHPLCGQG